MPDGRPSASRAAEGGQRRSGHREEVEVVVDEGVDAEREHAAQRAPLRPRRSAGSTSRRRAPDAERPRRRPSRRAGPARRRPGRRGTWKRDAVRLGCLGRVRSGTAAGRSRTCRRPRRPRAIPRDVRATPPTRRCGCSAHRSASRPGTFAHSPPRTATTPRRTGSPTFATSPTAPAHEHERARGDQHRPHEPLALGRERAGSGASTPRPRLRAPRAASTQRRSGRRRHGRRAAPRRRRAPAGVNAQRADDEPGACEDDQPRGRPPAAPGSSTSHRTTTATAPTTPARDWVSSIASAPPYTSRAPATRTPRPTLAREPEAEGDRRVREERERVPVADRLAEARDAVSVREERGDRDAEERPADRRRDDDGEEGRDAPGAGEERAREEAEGDEGEVDQAAAEPVPRAIAGDRPGDRDPGPGGQPGGAEIAVSAVRSRRGRGSTPRSEHPSAIPATTSAAIPTEASESTRDPSPWKTAAARSAPTATSRPVLRAAPSWERGSRSRVHRARG